MAGNSTTSELLQRFNIQNVEGIENVNEAELQKIKEIVELEIREKKSTEQKNLAWAAFATMIGSIALLFLPYISIERINAISNPIEVLLIACASVIGAFMGFTSWMNRK